MFVQVEPRDNVCGVAACGLFRIAETQLRAIFGKPKLRRRWAFCDDTSSYFELVFSPNAAYRSRFQELPKVAGRTGCAGTLSWAIVCYDTAAASKFMEWIEAHLAERQGMPNIEFVEIDDEEDNE